MSDQGAMSCSAAISGGDARSSATAENLLNAQVVRFMKPSASAPSVGASDDDVLLPLTAAELPAITLLSSPHLRLSTPLLISLHGGLLLFLRFVLV